MLNAPDTGLCGTGDDLKITPFEFGLPVMGKNMLSYLLTITFDNLVILQQTIKKQGVLSRLLTKVDSKA